MIYRTLGKTGFKVSEISLGTWQLGGKWGEKFDESLARDILQAAYEKGINCFDTADIYQDGMSEKSIGEFIRTKKERIYVITKIGRKTQPHTPSGYTADSIRKYVDESRNNLGMESLDLVLLHCPPTEVYYNNEVFETLDELKKIGKISHYGVSVETVDQAMAAMEHDVSAIEIIFNMFRLKPAETFFKAAKAENVGIIVRVPLASGLLSGKYTLSTCFGAGDHRSFNRNGEMFDKGETFSGVDYATGVEAAHALKTGLHSGNLAQTALKYILQYEEVSTVIPGASRPSQVIENANAIYLPDLTPEQMKFVKDVYDEKIRPLVHNQW